MANAVDARALGRRDRKCGPSASSRCECGQNPPTVHQSMVMARALMLALILLAIGPGGRGSASANSHGRPLPSAFVASRPPPSAAKDAAMGGVPPRRKPSRALPLAMVLSADRGDDETFFFRASQVAAQQRKERLRKGRDSLAVELSSSVGVATAVKEEEGKAMEGDEEEAVSEMEEETKGESKENPSASNDVKVPVDPFQLRQKQQQDPPIKPRGSDGFQRKLLETRLLMEENAKLARKVQELEEKNEGVAERTGEADQMVQDQAAENELAPVGSAVSEPITLDDYAALLSGMETKEEEEEKSEEEETKPPQASSTARSGPRLSSDGKEIFEPSPGQLAIDKEKVDMGLITLTRGLLALQSIVDREDS